MRSFSRGLTVALSALLVCGVAWALDSITPVHYRYTGTTGTGANTTATWRLAKSGAASTYVERSFTTSAASIGSIAKAIIKRGTAAGAAYYAAEAIINGAGWAINELSKQIQTGEATTEVLPGAFYYSNGNDGLKYGAGSSACAALHAVMGQVFQVDSWRYNSPTCYIKFQNGVKNAYTITQTQNTTSSPIATADAPPPEVSNDELGQKVIESGGENVNKLLEAGGVVQITPELLEQQNALKAAKAAQAGEPAPAPDVMPTAEEQANKQPEETELPKFCTWASVVCDFVEWMKKDDVESDAPEVPTEQADVKKVEWTSGISGGSCPTAQGITVHGIGGSQQLKFDYQPLCSFLDYLRPVLIAAALVLAAFIIAGAKNA